MSRTDIHLRVNDNEEFDRSIHLYATNEVVKLHNKIIYLMEA